jgi:hypothetical protein
VLVLVFAALLVHRGGSIVGMNIRCAADDVPPSYGFLESLAHLA